MNAHWKVVKFLSAIRPLLDQGHRLEHAELLEQSREFRELLQSLGVTYIKLGQILSVRYELLHVVTCKELQQLLDTGEPLPFSTVRQILTEELGPEWREKIEIEEEPLAVASIGQAHQGVIKNDGSLIVVKIQKPGVMEEIKTDMSALMNILRTASIIPTVAKSGLDIFLREFAELTYRELDYSIEAANTEYFAELYADDASIDAPRVYRTLSTDKVLTTEFIDGISLKQLISLFAQTDSETVSAKGQTISRRQIIDIGKHAIFSQIFVKNFIHGDPHPSNIFVTNGGKCFTYLDFGIVGKFSQRNSEALKAIIFHIVTGNRAKLAEVLWEMDTIKGSTASKEQVAQAIAPILDRYESSNSEEYSAAYTLLAVCLSLNQVDIQPPTFVLLMAKILTTYEGILRVIDPTVHIIKELQPLMQSLTTEHLLNKLSPKQIGKELNKTIDASAELVKVVRSLPYEASEILQLIKTEGIKIDEVADRTEAIEKTTRLKAAIAASLAIISLLVLVYATYQATSVSLFGLDFKLLLFSNWLILTATSLYFIYRKK